MAFSLMLISQTTSLLSLYTLLSLYIHNTLPSNKFTQERKLPKKKMGKNFPFLFILAISVLPFFGTISYADGQNKTTSTTINIISKVGKKSTPLRIICKIEEYIAFDQTFEEGDMYPYRTSTNETCYCTGVWNKYFANFQAYYDKRDKEEKYIFWKTTEEGFFLGYDNEDYNLDTPWEISNNRSV